MLKSCRALSNFRGVGVSKNGCASPRLIGTTFIPHTFLNRSPAALMYVGSLSKPRNRRFIFSAATADDPTPMNGSNTRSCSFEPSFRRCSSTLTGFCVGCFGFFNHSLPMQIAVSMKLRISLCFPKFHVWPLFHAHTIYSQLLRKPARLSFGAAC
jgi:hypothetical protein